MNCTPPAIDDFPKDVFTEKQRQDGAVILHVTASLYLFVALAIVCDKYFVPAVEKICQALNMSKDVAGATFMAAATSAPELFVNVIGTFITEGDIGVGTIVGSAVFNILAVASCCGIGAGTVVPLDWWPLTRDCLGYGVTVAILICIIHDERIEWYEALVLVLLYIVYIAIMYWDKAIQRCARRILRLNNKKTGATTAIGDVESNKNETDVKKGTTTIGFNETSDTKKIVSLEDLSVQTPPQCQTHIQQSSGPGQQQNGAVKNQTLKQEVFKEKNEQETDENDSPVFGPLFEWPCKQSCLKQIIWIAVWPMRLIFFVSIPDCEKPKYKKWFPLTFIMCIIWIGSLSYVVAWMITIIGDTLKIPDSVMGITFLAAGTSVPEAVSSVIVAKQGHGSMGISNSIGSNTFDILLCLGLPWLIKSSFLPINPGRHFVGINSRGLEYSAISLLSSLLLLYATFYSNKFKLDRKVGQICLLMYAVFLILASLIELNVFFDVNLPTCGR
ncbi:sodium/potassium/calcium exchanger 3 precursor, putative [Pediculus humanus corporis]|uniref:Sodium/potassium/calcium exchanger 5 n=1 Tax=Pediculus humanus subsp. corporis TaxID=121224 RepID=E0VRE9_PEDHC|nr:sodium/potassium/calcium exchanger 3 precursor, putative [Pediculus humanus corporis]EEB15955.1 sodium/potassium/calcium exchanger 3 precursor, putative [Pediculus humanus corporis]